MEMTSRRGFAHQGLLILASAIAGSAQQPANSPDPSYFVQTLGAREGIPSDYVSAILQDSRSYLWFGTPEGLTRSDGSVFTTFDRRNTQAFRSHNVGAVVEAGDGSLWVGTGGGGVRRFVDGRIDPDAQPELPHSEVTSLALSPGGALWIGCRGALCRLTGDELRCFDQKDGLPSQWIAGSVGSSGSQALAIDDAGRLWVATPEGAFVAESDAPLVRFATLAAPHGRFVSFFTEDSGRVWAGTNRGVVGEFVEGEFRASFRLGESTEVVALASGAGNSLWAGTRSRGLALLTTNKISWWTQEGALPSNEILSLRVDREENLWVGTARGLARVSQGLISQRGSREGLQGTTVIGLSRGSAGTWVVTAEGGLHHLDSDGFEPVPLDGTIATTDLRRVLETRSGNLWLGSRHGLYRRHEGGLARVDAIGDVSVSALFEEPSGRLWVGTPDDGFFASDDGVRWRRWTIADGLPDASVYTIARSPDGSIWVGTRKGLLQMASGKQLDDVSFVRAYGPEDGLHEPLIVSLHASDDGTLWIGTVSHGLVRFRDDEFLAVSEPEGLPDATVWAIVEDDFGSLWLSSNRGISRVAKEELERHFAGEQASIMATRYGPSDGLLEPDCVGGFLSAGLSLNDGRPAFATVQGVAIVAHPQFATASAPPPHAHVLGATADARKLPTGEEIRVPAGTRRFILQLGAPTHVSPEHLRIRARLQGYSNRWTEVDPDRQLTYTSMGPCRCTLETQTSRDGISWTAAGSQPIHFQAHWYEFATTRFAALALIFLTSAGFYRFRLWRAAEREQHLRREVERQTENLNATNEELEKANERLLELTLIDPLTGLANRRKFNEQLREEWNRARRLGTDFALIVVDVDHFKSLNDSLGHGAGDEALRSIGICIQQAARRAGDLAARLGGDEFCLLLPATTQKHAGDLAESIRRGVEDLALSYGQNQTVTVSLGVTIASPAGIGSARELVEEADRALYEAKARGRNRVHVAVV